MKRLIIALLLVAGCSQEDTNPLHGYWRLVDPGNYGLSACSFVLGTGVSEVIAESPGYGSWDGKYIQLHGDLVEIFIREVRIVDGQMVAKSMGVRKGSVNNEYRSVVFVRP